ncbi:hypothetical protein DPMN_142749 [Dreissena polymorpha]|uniref:Uncharacterized protein n=1 Tax=Dreissena polymorpha TaxID=45954 RepID=A0A9D4GBV6_DREPO|nr:hypothetical protein DPMN_142749 [Dreissena polymorpha]
MVLLVVGRVVVVMVIMVVVFGDSGGRCCGGFVVVISEAGELWAGRGGVGDGCCGYSGDAIVVVVVKLRCVGGVVESVDVMGLVVVATGVGLCESSQYFLSNVNPTPHDEAPHHVFCHIRKNAPDPCGHVFQPTGTISSVNKANVDAAQRRSQKLIISTLCSDFLLRKYIPMEPEWTPGTELKTRTPPENLTESTVPPEQF